MNCFLLFSFCCTHSFKHFLPACSKRPQRHQNFALWSPPPPFPIWTLLLEFWVKLMNFFIPIPNCTSTSPVRWCTAARTYQNFDKESKLQKWSFTLVLMAVLLPHCLHWTEFNYWTSKNAFSYMPEVWGFFFVTLPFSFEIPPPHPPMQQAKYPQSPFLLLINLCSLLH